MIKPLIAPDREKYKKDKIPKSAYPLPKKENDGAPWFKYVCFGNISCPK
tara:strand:+ start:1563 stop:1709 length:147 start_codon:yes stop_codon:yes gene_type:complete